MKKFIMPIVGRPAVYTQLNHNVEPPNQGIVPEHV